MRYVRQLDNTGCGLACLAMFANVGYKKVRSIAERKKICKDEYYGTSAEDLYRIGKELGLKVSRRRLVFKDYKSLPKQSMLIISYISKLHKERTWHWIICKKDKGKNIIIDPYYKSRVRCKKPTHYIKVERK